MWTVVYIAPNSNIAGQLKDLLESNGLLVSLNSLAAINPGDEAVEMLVPKSEAQEAYELIGRYLKTTN